MKLTDDHVYRIPLVVVGGGHASLLANELKGRCTSTINQAKLELALPLVSSAFDDHGLLRKYVCL